MSPQLLLLELNEVNFEFIEHYTRRGRLPNFAALLRRHGYVRTTSEERYEQLEPWIQWVTAHTGKSFAEHAVFRLGDIVARDIPQIWELLEEHGFKVGAISPMNAKHRLRDPAFFVPDPWTATAITAPPQLQRLYRAIAQAVSDNAQAKFTPSSAAALITGTLAYARRSNYLRYVAAALGAVHAPWRKAMVLDLLLSDVFIRQVRATTPHFASLFLNAAAHIQHHYMFCAEPYQGSQRNPAWYVAPGADPLLEVYELYDHLVADVSREFPAARLMLATGLHQVPHGEVTYYWRLKDHTAFLRRIGVAFERVDPRMSRDFLIDCGSSSAAIDAARRLSAAVASDGLCLFEVDNRGRELFVMLTYPREIHRDFLFTIDGTPYRDLWDQVAFVALKNGEHSGIGYFLDTGAPSDKPLAGFPLQQLPDRIMSALGIGARASTACG